MKNVSFILQKKLNRLFGQPNSIKAILSSSKKIHLKKCSSISRLFCPGWVFYSYLLYVALNLHLPYLNKGTVQILTVPCS